MTTRAALSFSVAGTRLALEAGSVREVVHAVALVTTPDMPGLLRGFLAIDGEMVPVIRLEQILDPHADSKPLRLTDRIVIAECDGAMVAWVVEGDMEMLQIQAADKVPLPGGHVFNHCATHVVAASPPIVLLEMNRLLLDAERARFDHLKERLQARLAGVATEGTAAHAA